MSVDADVFAEAKRAFASNNDPDDADDDLRARRAEDDNVAEMVLNGALIMADIEREHRASAAMPAALAGARTMARRMPDARRPR